MIYQLREENPESTYCLPCDKTEDIKCRWLFIANGKTMKYPVPVSCRSNITELVHLMYDHTSVLLRLCPVTDAQKERPMPRTTSLCSTHSESPRLNPPSSFRLSEPNVLLLDQAAYRIYAFGQEPGEWQPEDDILRADDICRKIAGFPGRGSYAQPWTRQKRPAAHTLELRFTIHSEIEISDGTLALEEADKTELFLNGIKIPGNPAAEGNTAAGYFVDECIQTLPLPVIPAGDSELIIA